MPAVWLPAVSLSLEDESLLSEVTTSPPFPWPGAAEFSSGARLWNPSLAPSLDPQAPLCYGRALGSSQAKPDLKKQPDSQWQWGPRLWGRVLTLRLSTLWGEGTGLGEQGKACPWPHCVAGSSLIFKELSLGACSAWTESGIGAPWGQGWYLFSVLLVLLNARYF